MAGSAITFSAREVSSYYAARVPHLKQAGAEFRGPCPVHEGKKNSFAVNPATGQAYCHSQCGRGWNMIGLERELTGAGFAAARDAVFQIVGRPAANGCRRRQARIAAAYDYIDEAGRLLFQAVRLDPKGFRQRKPDVKGGWAHDDVRAQQAYNHAVVLTQVARLQESLLERTELPRRWAAVIDDSDWTLWLTPRQARELMENIHDVLRGAAEAAPREKGDAVKGSAQYSINLHAFPRPGRLVPGARTDVEAS